MRLPWVPVPATASRQSMGGRPELAQPRTGSRPYTRTPTSVILAGHKPVTLHENRRQTMATKGSTAQAAPATAQTHPEPLDWSGILAQQGYVFGVDISGEAERVVLADVRGTVLGRDGFD